MGDTTPETGGERGERDSRERSHGRHSHEHSRYSHDHRSRYSHDHHSRYSHSRDYSHRTYSRHGTMYDDTSFAPRRKYVPKHVPLKKINELEFGLHVEDHFREPPQVLYHFLIKADHILLLHNDLPRQLGLAFMAGCFVSVGCLLSLWCTLNIREDLLGFERFMLGLSFSFGFVMVIITNSALFTEMNVLLPLFLLSNMKQWVWQVVRLWLIVWLGNLLGMMFMGLMMNAGLMVDDVVIVRLEHLLEEKLIWKTLGAAGWFQCLASGVVGNFLIGMAAFLSAAAVDFTGSALGVIIPAIAFVAVGAQHSPANTGYTCLAWINVSEREPIHFELGDMIAWNLIPATIGNIIGGTVMVGGIMFYLHGAPIDEIREFFVSTLEVEAQAEADEAAATREDDSEMA